LGVALAVLLVGESVPTSLWAGLVLVVAGVAAMTMRPRWKSKDEP
jgi:drug/metabolite transporter (DMT)-like permease